MNTKPTAMLWELISRLANTSLTICINGEKGVGKEAIARLLSAHYPHQNATILIFNCRDLGTVSRDKAAQRLGANTVVELEAALAEPQNKVFYFENIESLPADLQPRLHDMLGRDYPKAPPWVLASSIEPLDQYRGSHQISEQLCNDLNTIHIALPALRTRPDRIPQILSGILANTGCDNASGLPTMPDAQSMRRLIHYPWPGNLRQLQQVALEAARSNEWREALDTVEDMTTVNHTKINEMSAIHILSTARFYIRKERVLEGLVNASTVEEVGLLDLAIFNEAVAQIDSYISADEIEEDY